MTAPCRITIYEVREGVYRAQCDCGYRTPPTSKDLAEAYSLEHLGYPPAETSDSESGQAVSDV